MCNGFIFQNDICTIFPYCMLSLNGPLLVWLKNVQLTIAPLGYMHGSAICHSQFDNTDGKIREEKCTALALFYPNTLKVWCDDVCCATHNRDVIVWLCI